MNAISGANTTNQLRAPTGKNTNRSADQQPAADTFTPGAQGNPLGLIEKMYPLVGGQITGGPLAEMLEQVPEWDLKNVEGFERIQRTFPFKNFRQAVAFSNSIAEFAGQQGHHPTLLTEWGKVTVGWWTHDVGGLHANDILSARRTDALLQKG